MPAATPPPPSVDSVAGTIALIGDRWTLLILREAFFGVRRFGQMQRNLDVAKTVLSARLKHLTAEGLLERVAYREDPVWFEYRLTEKGLDLWPVVVALLQWGDKHLQAGGPPIRLRHVTCGHADGAEVVCGHCREPLDARATSPEAG